MAAGGFAAIGGPMQDIPLATGGNHCSPPETSPLSCASRWWRPPGGLLIGMLSALSLVAAFGTPIIVLACGAGIVVIGALGPILRGGSRRRTEGNLVPGVAERRWVNHRL